MPQLTEEEMDEVTESLRCEYCGDVHTNYLGGIDCKLNQIIILLENKMR